VNIGVSTTTPPHVVGPSPQPPPPRGRGVFGDLQWSRGGCEGPERGGVVGRPWTGFSPVPNIDAPWVSASVTAPVPRTPAIGTRPGGGAGGGDTPSRWPQGVALFPAHHLGDCTKWLRSPGWLTLPTHTRTGKGNPSLPPPRRIRLEARSRFGAQGTRTQIS